MARFKHYDYSQTPMVVIDYQDRLQTGTSSQLPVRQYWQNIIYN